MKREDGRKLSEIGEAVSLTRTAVCKALKMYREGGWKALGGKRALKEKAEIYWGDETGLRSSDVGGRGYAPRGETPIVTATAKYENLAYGIGNHEQRSGGLSMLTGSSSF